MVTFEGLLGSLSLEVPRRSKLLGTTDVGAPCYFSGALILQGRDLLGPGDAKTTWEILGYQVGIQHFEITVSSPTHNIKLWHADRPVGSTPVSADAQAAGASAGAGLIGFQPRKWTPNGQIAVEFSIAIPGDLFPPHDMAHQYQVSASATVAIINKDLGMGPIYMRRTASPVILEISRHRSGWPWPQQHPQQAQQTA